MFSMNVVSCCPEKVNGETTVSFFYQLKEANNVFFTSAKEFREAIAGFFEHKIHTLAPNLKNRINDNFQTMTMPVPSG
jgi:hypothetical protein